MNAQRKTKSGSEFEAVDKKARRGHHYLQRAGVSSSIKRSMRRRERHEGKLYIRFADN